MKIPDKIRSICRAVLLTKLTFKRLGQRNYRSSAACRFFSTLVFLSLSGCSTIYEMRAGDFNAAQALPPNDSLSIAEKANQNWYAAVKNNFAYVTFESRINSAFADHNIFVDLGCNSNPISLASRQQSFVLTGAFTDNIATKFPLFSFSRNDASHTCTLDATPVTLGPYKVAAPSYTIVASINSSTADKITADEFYQAALPVLGAFGVGTTTPVIGGSTAVANNIALQNFEAYLNKNMQLSLLSNAAFVQVNVSDIAKGVLVYVSELSIHKLDSSNDTKLPIGRVELTVKTALSLFTTSTISKTPTEWKEINATEGTAFDMPFLPDYIFTDTWIANVIPVGMTSKQQLATGIDATEPLAANKILPKLNALTENSTPAEIDAVCNAIRGRLQLMEFDFEDILAITAHALLKHAPGAETGANYATGRNNCFNKNERALMKQMHIPTGNDDPSFKYLFQLK